MVEKLSNVSPKTCELVADVEEAPSATIQMHVNDTGIVIRRGD